jgi:hypothetical protein
MNIMEKPSVRAGYRHWVWVGVVVVLAAVLYLVLISSS